MVPTTDSRFGLGRVGVLAVFLADRVRHPTGLLAGGTRAPMATVHFAAMTVGLLTGWMVVRARLAFLFNATDLTLLVGPSAALAFRR